MIIPSQRVSQQKKVSHKIIFSHINANSEKYCTWKSNNLEYQLSRTKYSLSLVGLRHVIRNEYIIQHYKQVWRFYWFYGVRLKFIVHVSVGLDCTRACFSIVKLILRLNHGYSIEDLRKDGRHQTIITDIEKTCPSPVFHFCWWKPLFSNILGRFWCSRNGFMYLIGGDVSDFVHDSVIVWDLPNSD